MRADNPLREFYDTVVEHPEFSALEFKFSILEARRFATARLAWAVPTDEAVDAVAEEFVRAGTVVEIGAGRGYWARLLADRGVGVRCFDRFSDDEDPRENRYVAVAPLATYRVPADVRCLMSEIDSRTPQFFHPVERGGAERATDGDVLFLCWPVMDDTAYAALDAFDGCTVVYVGEGMGGCTADDSFFDRLYAEWRRYRSVDIPQWYGIHDGLEIWRRR